MRASAPVVRSFGTRPANPSTRQRSPADAARRALPVVAVTAEQAVDLGHGKRVDASAVDLDAGAEGAAADGAGDRGPFAAIDPDDRLVAIVERRGATLNVVTGFPPEEAKP